MKYNIIISTKCKKDIKKAKAQGKDIDHLFQVIDLLSDGIKLPDKYKDHKLLGKYAGKRECHIEPDFLLIYEYSENDLILFLIRVGSHSQILQ